MRTSGGEVEAAMDERSFFCHSSFNAGGHVQLVCRLSGSCKTLSLMAGCQVRWSQRRRKTHTHHTIWFLHRPSQSILLPSSGPRIPLSCKRVSNAPKTFHYSVKAILTEVRKGGRVIWGMWCYQCHISANELISAFIISRNSQFSEYQCMSCSSRQPWHTARAWTA